MSSKADSRSESRKSRHTSSKSASRESISKIATMEPGRALDDAVVKKLAGMEKGMERQRAQSRSHGKRALTSPTPMHTSSELHTSKVLRMDQDRPALNPNLPSEVEEDWALQVEKEKDALKKDENQNKPPDGKVGSSCSNGC